MFDISIFFIYRILHYVKQKGIAPEILLEKAGIDLLSIGRFDSKIPARHYLSIMEEAVRLTGDEFLGLHVGASTELRDLSNLGYIMAGCKDMGEAIGSAIGYIDFIGAPVELRLERGTDRGRLIFYLKEPFNLNTRQCVDEALSSFFSILNDITNNQFKPEEIHFSYPAPEDIRALKKTFSCRVRFGQAASALVFHPRELLNPVVRPNPKLLLMARQQRDRIKEIVEEKDYSRKITILLYAGLQNGPPCIKHVAKELGVSIRGLQMRLSEEGVTFSRIVRDVRRELAKTYLADRDYSIDEITFLLGFSEPSVFHRAFKTWTGLTPGEYRNDVTLAQAPQTGNTVWATGAG
jgi:AraC-like DNA-binding protein